MRGNRERGYILPTVVMVVAVLTVTGVSLLQVCMRESVQVRRESDSVQAFNLAEAGIERALWKMSTVSAWTDGWNDVPLGKGSYSVTVEDQGDYWYLITSSGRANTITKTVTLRVRMIHSLWPPQFLEYVLFCANPTDSPTPTRVKNNAEISGDIFAYGNMTIENNVSITEGAIYATGTISAGGAYIPGELPDPLPGRLEFDTAFYDDLIAQAGQQSAADWTVDASEYHLDGQTRLVNGNVVITNNARLYGPGRIVATGDIDIMNNCYVYVGIDFVAERTVSIHNLTAMETQGNVIFGREAIDLQNNAGTTGGSVFVMSPGRLTLRNNGRTQGVFWGGDVDMSNNLAIEGSVYADTFAGGIRNEVRIKQAWPLFPPPPGVPQMETVIVRPGVWAEQEAIGL